MENNQIQTKGELIDILGGNKKEEILTDFSKLRYVLYARKSTDETDKQVRSLQDQVNECKEFAIDKRYNIADIILESESAKYSGMRPKFNQMLKDIENDKYDGILAWHPNRLARNMKEAGEIIDLLDKKIIKDLKFASFYFENSASGKLTLGITFALAKQYTDQLSEDVTRGNQRSTLEGKSINIPKHGYKKNRNGQLEPNGENFALIKEAFKMRIDEKTMEEICIFLNNSGYCRYKIINKEKKEYGNVPYKFNKDTLTTVFKNPIYIGILQHGAIMAELDKIYDFEPMISIEDFCKINKITKDKLILKAHQKTGIKAKLLNGRIKCDLCKHPMTAGITNKKLESGKIAHIFYYRCANKKCINYGKSIRANEIRNSIANCLSNYDISEEKAFNIYRNEIKEKSENEDNVMLNNIKSINIKIRNLNVRLEKTKETLNNLSLSKDNHSLVDMYKNDVVEIMNDIKLSENELTKIKQDRIKNSVVILTLEKIVEPVRILPNVIRKTETLEKLENILKNVCLNCYVDNKKVVKLELKEPLNGFMELKKDPKVLSGGHTKS